MWVVRDKDGTLTQFVAMPIRLSKRWITTGYQKENFIRLQITLFPSLTWEDEPIEVKLMEVKMSTERNDVEKDLTQDSIDIKQLTCDYCAFFYDEGVYCNKVNMEVYKNTPACTSIILLK